MEEKKKTPLMDDEEYKEYLERQIDKNLENGILPLTAFGAVGRFKSSTRAFRRGHMSPYGIAYPKRPFNNRGNSSKRKGSHSRSMNERKKAIYEQFKRRSEIY